MIFGQTLPHLLSKIMGSYPSLVPVFVSKVDLRDSRMIFLVLPKYILALEFLFTQSLVDSGPLISFHISIPMEYLEIVPLFFLATDTVADLKIRHKVPAMPKNAPPPSQ